MYAVCCMPPPSITARTFLKATPGIPINTTVVAIIYVMGKGVRTPSRQGGNPRRTIPYVNAFIKLLHPILLWYGADRTVYRTSLVQEDRPHGIVTKVIWYRKSCQLLRS